MLYTGALNAQRCRFIGSAAGAGRGANRNLSLSPRLGIGIFVGGVNAKTSVPDGYRGGVATLMARSDGGMAARLTGSGAFSALNISGAGNIDADLTGSCSFNTVNLAGGVNISSNMTGGGSISSNDLRGKARLVCNISIGAQPSADDIAEAVIGKIITGATQANTVADALKKTLKRDEFIGLS